MRKNSIPNPVMIGALVLIVATGFLSACKRGGGGDSTSGTTSAVSAADIAKGKELYVKNTCSTCHGDTGLGDGPAGKVLKPPPRNLQLASSYKQGGTAADIAETVKTGIPGTNMAAFAHISEADRNLIAQYIVSLQKK